MWSYPGRPRPIPAPEGRAHIAATSPYWRKTRVHQEVTDDDDRAAGRRRFETVEERRETNKWQQRHTKRRTICEALRRAAWYVRRHWARNEEEWIVDDSGPNGWDASNAPPGWRVEGGERAGEGCPVVGLAVVDPLDLFNELDTCCSNAAIRPTTGGVHGNVTVMPRRCKRHKVCPVCGHQDAMERGERVTVVAGRAGRPGAVLHIALTHRDMPPGLETCWRAWDRYEGAWQRLRTGRMGEWFRANVYGFVMNLETTNGLTGLTWHPHAHFILELREGVDVETFRDELAQRWARCTTLAAVRAGLSDRYLAELERFRRTRVKGDPSARELALCAVEGEVGWSRASGWKDGRERWCETIGDTEEQVRAACAQASKYPNKDIGVETPARLAEWIQWAHGRRFCRWGGAWDDDQVQLWIDEQIAYTAREFHLEQVRLGNRPDVGDLIKGAQTTVTTDDAEAARLASGEIHFEQLGAWRSVVEVDAVRGWWAMLAEHRVALRAARKALDGPDDMRTLEYAELDRVLAHIRRQPFAEARPMWARVKAEIDRNGPFG